LPTITIETRIAAPRERVFDLSCDVDAHAESSSFTGERIVEPGRTSGLLQLGHLLTFEGRHLGVRQRVTVRITEMDPPRRYVDVGVHCALRELHHVHDFEEIDGGATLMRDIVTWRSPFGILGRAADALVVARHMRWFVSEKQARLKRMAEERYPLR
jgi:ligand-binding SRPBCC domain-containing protein